jgi:recombination protein RecR
VEGDTTALFLQRQLSSAGLRISRLARGLPSGGSLESADQLTLARALDGRERLN